MEQVVKVCPKCGYRHETAGGKECPRCGIIYDKYYARQAASMKPEKAPPDPGAVPGSAARKPVPTFIVAGAVVILIIAGVVGWKYSGGSRGASESTSSSTEKIIRSFPYDIRGTYGARFTHEFDGGSAGPAYAYSADYEAGLSVSDQYRINQLSWTDNHTTLSRTKINWSSPSVAEVFCEERSGGTPEKNREPFTQPLTLRRLGNALALDYHKPSAGGEVVFDWKNAVKGPLPGEGTNGMFEYLKDQDALRAVVKVVVVPKGILDVPRESMTTFNTNSFWAGGCVIDSLRSSLPPRLEGGLYRGINCDKLSLFSASVSFNLKLTNVDIPVEVVVNKGPYSTVPLNPIQPTNDTKFLFDGGFDREAEVLFYRDGKKKLRIKDRKVGEKPLEYDLERL